MAGPRGVECRIHYDTQQEKDVFRWYLYDGLGSVLSEVDDEGNVKLATTKYDVYGAAVAQEGSTDSKHHFVGSIGHQTEPSTGGLVYMRARWYDPATGRFVSEDPAQDGVNWYGYCGNNPVNGVDPDGKLCLLDDLFSVFVGLYNDAKDGAAALGFERWAQEKVARVVASRTFQIYGFLLEAGGDDATFFVNKEGKGFGWAVNGTARAFVHVFQLHGKGWHIDFQFDGERIFQEFL